MSDAARAKTSESAPVVAGVPAPSSERESDETPKRSRSEAELREAWSRRMLPWMIRMVVGLTVFFFLASAAQLAYLHYEITTSPTTDIDRALDMMTGAPTVSTGAKRTSSLPAAAVAALSMLELGAMERRYHQANVSLLSRVWTRYLGFVTGMVLAMVGAAFILGRLETATATTAKAPTPGGPLDLSSTSPGLILAGLGVALMITTIVIHHEIEVQDQPIYAKGWSFGAESPTAAGASAGQRPAPLRQAEPDQQPAEGSGVLPSEDLGRIFGSPSEKLAPAEPPASAKGLAPSQ